ncbi:hypothetical protein HY570_01090 [Candidatus Micrarchaeota archaeon]|nr:hypothetical protein [Candidatus Micrarchaeota archaeon]
MKRFILLLFLFSNVYGLCVEADREILAPAVGNNGVGELIKIGVRLSGGSGDILFSIPPYIGVFTQSSFITATKVAFVIARKDLNDCDVTLEVDPAYTDTIDGPSGGAALTLMILSALQNKTIKNNLSITGTIEENGDVGQVGGISEKLEAAALSGIRVFLLPKQDRDTKLAVFIIKNKYNVTVIEVNNIIEAGNIAFLNGKSEVESNLFLEKNNLPKNLTPINREQPNPDALYRIGKNFTMKGEFYINEFNPESEEDKNFLDFFKNELDLANELLDMGYLYSGANTAFLATVDLEFLKEENPTIEKINSTINEVSICVSSIPKRNFTEEHFELEIGSELRKNWALKKLNEVNDTVSKQTRVFSPYHEVLFAKAWCGISKSLQSSEDSSRELQEGKLKALAFDKIEQAERSLKNKSFAGMEDLTWHLETAKQAYNKGDYGAAIYDSSYSIAIARATEEFGNSEPFRAKQMTENLLNTQTKHFWAGAFKAHSRYYYARYSESNDPFELLVAYRLATYSLELDNVTEKIREELHNDGYSNNTESIQINQTSAQTQGKQNYVEQIIFPAILVMLVINLILQLYWINHRNK